MRTGALALMLLVTACGRGDGGNAVDASANGAAATDFAGEDRVAAATLALAAGPGGCSARWDGQPATAAQVLDRSSALIERAIQQQGSVANLTDETLPTVAITAPGSLGFACVDTYLAAIRRAGVPNVVLAPDGRPGALADFTLSDIGAPPPAVVIAIGGGGRLHWNEEAIGPDAIAERLRRRAGGAEPGVETPPGELELRPAREATFGQVYEALAAVRAGRSRVALLLPSVTPTRPPPAAPAPPPTGNQAAPRP
jgi:biopolymer transport protein ExbD